MFLQGYGSTGIKDITDSIGIPKGSFYNHFSSKEEFGLEVVKTYCDNGVKLYEKRFLHSDLPPLERFDDFFTVLIQNYQNSMQCKLGCVMSNFAAEMADVNENFRLLLDDEFDRHQSIMEQCLAEAQERGELSEDEDVEAMASFILNGWHGALVRMKATASVEPLETFKRFVLSKILK